MAAVRAGEARHSSEEPYTRGIITSKLDGGDYHLVGSVRSSKMSVEYLNLLSVPSQGHPVPAADGL